MAFKFPYGNEQQLNLNWFIKKFKDLLADWQREKESIDGALDAEIQRAEDALSDVYTARDVTIAAKNDALQAKADALTAAANAAQYWQNAAASANSAATSAVTALQAAQDAADDAAQTSSDRAGVAADKAAVAADKATVASDKATVASDKATVAAYKAAVEQDKADIDDIKDAANAAALRSEGWAVGEQNGTPVASGSPYYENNSKYFKEQAEDVLDSIPADYTALSNDVDELKDDVAELQQQSGGIVKTIENVAVASFDDGLAAPLQDLIVNIESVQTGSGDPSPTNVRPIAGWTGCEVNRTGVNVWDEEWELGGINNSGQPTVSDSSIRSKNYISAKPSTPYCIVTNGSIGIFEYDVNHSFIKKSTFNSGNSGIVLTTDQNTYYLMIGFGSSYGSSYENGVSINYPSTDHNYHAYTGATISVTFPDTVYGGKHKFINGKLMRNMGMILLDENSNISRVGTNTFRITPENAKIIPSAYDTTVYTMCDTLKSVSPLNLSNTFEIALRVLGQIWFILNVDTVNEAKQFFGNNPTTIIYPLETPEEIQLTPQEVKIGRAHV